MIIIILLEFLIILHGRTDVLVPTLLMVYTNSDHFKLLLTHILLPFLHRPVWRGFVALTVTYFHWHY